MSSPAPAAVSRTARSLAAALVGDPFYRTVTVACGDDEAARLAMLEAYFALALAEGEQAGRVDLADAAGHGAAIWTTDTPADQRQAAYAQRETALQRQGRRPPLGQQRQIDAEAAVGRLRARHRLEQIGRAHV